MANRKIEISDKGLLIFSKDENGKDIAWLESELNAMNIPFHRVNLDMPVPMIDALEHGPRTFPNVAGTIEMYEVDSSNLSQIGAVPFNPEITEQPYWVVYIVFKGNAVYRYYPVPDKVWQDLCSEAIKAARGDKSASVGSYYHNFIRVPADEGAFACHKLDDENIWREVPPKVMRRK